MTTSASNRLDEKAQQTEQTNKLGGTAPGEVGFVLLDDGRFPLDRAARIARQADRIAVLGGDGELAEMIRPYCQQVTAVASSDPDVAEAIALAAQMDAVLVMAGRPKSAHHFLESAVTGSLEALEQGKSALGVAVLRSTRSNKGPVAVVAQDRWVSGYAAYYGVGWAASTGRSNLMVMPPGIKPEARHEEVQEQALNLAQAADVDFTVQMESEPIEWAIDQSKHLNAVVVGVLNAEGRVDGDEVKLRRRGGHLGAAGKILRKADCDVLMILDAISLAEGPKAGAKVAAALGATLLTTAAVAGAAGPAAAAPTGDGGADDVAIVQTVDSATAQAGVGDPMAVSARGPLGVSGTSSASAGQGISTTSASEVLGASGSATAAAGPEIANSSPGVLRADGITDAAAGPEIANSSPGVLRADGITDAAAGPLVSNDQEEPGDGSLGVSGTNEAGLSISSDSDGQAKASADSAATLAGEAGSNRLGASGTDDTVGADEVAGTSQTDAAGAVEQASLPQPGVLAGLAAGITAIAGGVAIAGRRRRAKDQPKG